MCNKGITQFYLPPTHARTIPAFIPQLQASPPFGWYSLRLPTKGWPGWVNLGGWSHTETNVPHRELNPDTVTHLSTNRAQRWLTSLIEANALTTTPDHQCYRLLILVLIHTFHSLCVSFTVVYRCCTLFWICVCGVRAGTRHRFAGKQHGNAWQFRGEHGACTRTCPARGSGGTLWQCACRSVRRWLVHLCQTRSWVHRACASNQGLRFCCLVSPSDSRKGGNCECIAAWGCPISHQSFWAVLYCACAKTAISRLPINILTLPLDSATPVC